jgi:hypothetical protein
LALKDNQFGDTLTNDTLCWKSFQSIDGRARRQFHYIFI